MGYSPCGHKELDMTEHAHVIFQNNQHQRVTVNPTPTSPRSIAPFILLTKSD